MPKKIIKAAAVINKYFFQEPPPVLICVADEGAPGGVAFDTTSVFAKISSGSDFPVCAFGRGMVWMAGAATEGADAGFGAGGGGGDVGAPTGAGGGNGVGMDLAVGGVDTGGDATGSTGRLEGGLGIKT